MRKNLFKRLALLSCLIMSSALMSGYTPVEGTGHPDEWNTDTSQYVYDYADVFTSEQELKLQERAEQIGKELEMDIVIVSATDLGGKHEETYADDFYDYGGYSESGALYLIDLDHDAIALSTAGLGMVYIDHVDEDTILDAIWEEYEKYDYYDSAKVFIDTVEDIVGSRKGDADFEKLEKLWYDGGFHDYDDFIAVHSSDVKEAFKETFFTSFQNPLMCMGVGAVVALIAVLIMCFSSSTKMTAGSKTYMRNGSFNILHRFDRFTHTTTTTHKVNSSSGGSGGGSRGGASSRRSSSGRSHGGGSRRR